MGVERNECNMAKTPVVGYVLGFIFTISSFVLMILWENILLDNLFLGVVICLGLSVVFTFGTAFYDCYCRYRYEKEHGL